MYFGNLNTDDVLIGAFKVCGFDNTVPLNDQELLRKLGETTI
jgi:hypothetical protein